MENQRVVSVIVFRKMCEYESVARRDSTVTEKTVKSCRKYTNLNFRDGSYTQASLGFSVYRKRYISQVAIGESNVFEEDK
jgi:hypothetical protein